MKKILSIILAATLILSLAGCGSNNSGTDGDGESGNHVSEGDKNKGKSLKVWLPPLTTDQNDKEVWDNIMKTFEEEKGVTVDVEIVPWGNYEEKYLTGITSGQGPDVGYMYMEMMGDFVDMDALEPLDDYLTSEDRERLLYLDNGIVQGKQYCLPFIVGNAVVMCYNKDILEDNGISEIPETWDEFIEVAKQIETDTNGDGKDDIYRLVQKWGNPAISTLNTSVYPYLWQNGAQLFNDEGTALNIDTDEAREALQFLYDLRFEHDILPDLTTSLTQDDCINIFAEGKAAFVEMETTNTTVFDDNNVNWDFITSLSKKSKGTFMASDSLVLMSSSENKDLAYELIQYMLSKEAMTEYHQSAPFPPVSTDEEYNDAPRFETIYRDDSDALHSLDAIKGGHKIYDMFYKNLQLMMIGESSVDEVIQETTEYAETILKE